MGVEKNRYRTPGPGAYDVRKASAQCLKSAPAVAFGGAFNRVDRQKTGPLKVLGEKEYVPGPCSYAVEAEQQARDLCERPHGLVFGRAMRDDLGKLFLGKDAVAYITRRTPGPGAYELGWQRPVFLFPSRESGTTIGGPLANVDRVQTGPLGAAYRSDTPGPGAYNETDDRGIRVAPTQRSIDCKGYYSTGGRTSSWSGTDPGRASTRYIGLLDDTDSRLGIDSNRPASQRGVRDGKGYVSSGSSCKGRPGASAKDPFSLSPFRFVDRQGNENWQLPLLDPQRPNTTPFRRTPRSSGSRSRSVPRREKRSRERDLRSKGSTSSLSAGDSRVSWQSSTRPVTTFGTGTREQAGQVLAPGFKGYAPRSTIGNPGPGAYRNVPGSLGQQVDSTLVSSIANSFGQSGRVERSTRDTGVPGPGSYRAVSSLGNQISSTCATAPQPKFGTSVRCALEDGLVG